MDRVTETTGVLWRSPLIPAADSGRAALPPYKGHAAGAERSRRDLDLRPAPHAPRTQMDCTALRLEPPRHGRLGAGRSGDLRRDG